MATGAAEWGRAARARRAPGKRKTTLLYGRERQRTDSCIVYRDTEYKAIRKVVCFHCTSLVHLRNYVVLKRAFNRLELE